LSKYLANAAKALKKGDYLLLSYSGHGGQVPDTNSDESDGLDETWCLYDGEFLDDELYAAFGKFKEGVRIAVFSDSCHSGTMIKNTLISRAAARAQPEKRYRAMPPEFVQSVYLKNQQFYDKIQAKGIVAPEAVAASGILISGCQDNQLSADGAFKKKGYHALQKAVLKLMPPDQSPNYFMIGKKDAKFDKVRPFTIES
jgi:hypothetical protein